MPWPRPGCRPSPPASPSSNGAPLDAEHLSDLQRQLYLRNQEAEREFYLKERAGVEVRLIEIERQLSEARSRGCRSLSGSADRRRSRSVDPDPARGRAARAVCSPAAAAFAASLIRSGRAVRV